MFQRLVFSPFFLKPKSQAPGKSINYAFFMQTTSLEKVVNAVA